MPLVLLAYLVPYAVRARALRRAGRPVPAWRVACFAAGLGVLGAVLTGPVGALADRRFAGHMAEHLALGDIAPLLLVLGCSGPLVAPLLRLRPVRALRGLTHPVAAASLWAANLYAWHLTGPYGLALRSDAVHVLQHASFLVTGILLWTALLGPLPKPAWFGTPARMAYVACAWLASSALGAALVFASTPFYAHYVRLEGAARAAADQSTGGALMMVEGATIAVLLLCRLFLRLWQEAADRQELAELAAAAGVALDPRRAARAVDAGAADLLRHRIEGGRP